MSYGGAVGRCVAANVAQIGSRVARDKGPDNAAYPFVSYRDPISSTRLLRGDRKTIARRLRIQLDLWQSMDQQDQTGETGEDDTIVPALLAALDGADLNRYSPPGKVLGCFVEGHRRVPDPVDKIIHVAFDVIVTHVGD